MELPRLQGKSILVTGGAGFIGSHLVEALVGDNKVRVLDDFSRGREEWVPNGINVFKGDIRNRNVVDEAVNGVDLIYHEAAQIDVSRSVDSPIESQAINVRGTLNVLEAARRANARTVIASSAAIYGHPEYVPIDENARRTPESPYGLEKLAVDQYAQLYHQLYDLETVPLRYFNVYGPRQNGGDYSGVIDVFIRQALDGEPLTVHGDGNQTRDFVHVWDVVKANLLAAKTDRFGEPMNIATGDSVSVRDLANLVIEVTGETLDVTRLDPRPGDIDESRADVSRAKKLIGYEPSIPLRQGLESVVDWYRN